MRFGICADSADVGTVEQVGYDFVELGVAELAPEQPQSAFAPVKERILSSGIRAEALNRLFPRGLMVVGPDVDRPRVEAFVETAFARAAEIGTRTIVWGSPHARHVPDGFSRERAYEQLADVGRFIGGVAAGHGLVVVVEPLDRTTTNTIWTVADGYAVAREIDHPAFKTMADIYQMAKNDEPLAGMRAAGELLWHVHFSDPDRLPPGNPAHFAFYREAFGVLRSMGYDSRISVEARYRDFESDARRALEVLLKLYSEVDQAPSSDSAA